MPWTNYEMGATVRVFFINQLHYILHNSCLIVAKGTKLSKSESYFKFVQKSNSIN